MKNLVRIILGDNAYACLRRRVRKSPPLLQTAEEKMAVIKREKFYSLFVKKGDLCFDVGANVGNRVDALLGVGARVVAVEPQESCYQVLKRKYGRKVVLVKKGLGEVEAVKDFYISDSHTLSSFSKEFVDIGKEGRFKNYHWHEPVKVKITTLDKLIKKYGKPEFIKIDVEGYELEVLLGLSIPVRMISFEYTVPEQTDRVTACIKQIVKYNPDVECNFSIGESMEFALEQWLSVSEMNQLVLSDNFNNSEFGDVYCRTKK